ncbi:hypothetical protein CHGG_02708 [Chaetomium globosum CBS 148.51]|uniref:Reverse transcriptase domain-containing protein n=1 Tax=Chaetomium globosum (strain ATCC 6205 / CBS 148.51 / DSM 1962 / NBRC 6347 / NRRL 1970) TaxID=306901 RepID=Q2HAP6_CHAGB|nr:uncharacterized protein CHGG_02708 [Chaetomium globosum CBS 148.51]EAQ90773.1 hypothetical protein CHGG_02708 [Chaetomium globosum CBS 148.51]
MEVNYDTIIRVLGPQGLRAQVREQEGLKEAFNWLVEELQRIAEVATPRKKANRGHGSPWWSVEVQEAQGEARRAERECKAAPSEHNKERLNQGLRALAATINKEKTKTWRTTMQKATHKTDLLWSLERWARCRSFAPPDPPKLPALTGPPGGQDLSTQKEKAEALARRFYPNPEADLSDIEDPDLLEQWVPKFNIEEKVTVGDVRAVLSKISPWKAPGEDHLPIGLLKACGRPLFKVLAVLTEACFRIGWFPEIFKRAKTVVLQKPGKEPSTYRTPGGYRPIALLPTVGKVIEALVAERITSAAEAYGLLPAEQMGNREHRSTEVAIRLVVAQVQEAWRQKATASLLQLDISGAFDTVNHTRLLATLRLQGYPQWVVLWVKAWLSNRVAILHFDGQKTEDIPVIAGVPQGSPLSPILFILYIASLYQALKTAHPLVSIVGFADDTNLLAFGKNPDANTQQLEKAWKTCLQWAGTRGMAFAAQKCELIHFNKGRRQWENPVALAHPGASGYSTVKPVESARFLGVWLDWKLSWRAHHQAVERKLKTQDFALSRIAAKTWGPSLSRAREVYVKCIRSAIAYGASSFHQPTAPRATGPKGPAKVLSKAQNRSLRIVVGAYKSAPIRCLETEAWVPPLDLYLNKRLADFEGRLQKQALQSGAGPEAERITTGHLITEACNKVYRSSDETHEGLTKAQSSLLSQARIGDIGLRDYLFRVKVPEVRTPYCECGRGRETVEHLVAWCPDPPLQRPWDGREIRSHRDLQTVLRGVGARSRRFVRKVLGWLMDSGRLLEYRLARRLELETVDGEG